jgi:hypothetical protein
MTSSLGESALRVPQTSPTQIPPKKTSSTSNPPLHPVLKSCRKRSVPAQLDLHYITDQILVTSAPVEALQPTYKDIGRNPQPPNRTSSAEQTELRNTSAALSHAETPLSDSEPKDSAIDPAQTSSQRKPVANHAGSPSTSLHGPQVSSIAAGNSAVDLSLFLETQFASANYLLVCLSDKLPDDHFLILLRRQIVRLPWTAPGSPASETPTVSTLLRFCYLLHAWLHDPEHVVVVYCENGKTRSGLAVAAYLAFAGMSGVETCAQGFAHFVSCRCPEAPDPRAAFSSLPASLRLLFRNFDQGIEAGLKRNREPLLLRAISLQGVPVEEKPCLDIWDARGRHIYSSHPDLWDDLLETIPVLAGNDCYNLSSRASQWANEEGFFKVNVVLEGDFCLLCRFGGAHANKGLGETSTQLFRYVNTTVAMSTGQCELRFMHVDVMRRYVPFLNSDDFLLTLVLEADWNCRRKAMVPLLLNSCNAEAALDFLKGDKAREKGWQVLSAYHAAQPSPFDSACFVETLETSLQSCPSNLIALALQLSNFDYKAALNMLMKRSPCPWRQGLNWGDDPTAHADAPTALVQDTVYSLDTASQGSATDSSLSGFTRCSGEPSRREDRANNGPPLVPSKTSREGPISPIPLEALENLEATDFTSEMSSGAIVPQQMLDLNEEAIFSSRLSRSSSSDNKPDALSNTQIGKLSNPKSEVSMELAIKADPRFEKYYKMHAVGLPEGAIRNACVRDGVDASFLDLDWDRSYISQTTKPINDDMNSGTPVKDDPEYAKYFKMLHMGLPPGAVENALTRDGKDPKILKFVQNKSVDFQLTSGGRHTNSATKEASRVRRKKIYWNTLDHSRIKEDSLWTLVRNRVHMSHLNYDVKEFKELFTESADPAQQRRKKQQRDTTKAKKSVQVIDGKRSMNGGIILLRLKLDYKKIARLVNSMEHGKLDATQIMALKEFLPSIEERRGLSTYMKTHGQSDETKMKAYRELSECEKYMFTMMEVSDAPQKFDCMLFRVQFKIRFAEVMESVRVVQRACEEVRSSERLREILAIILTLVNEINTGGDGKGATGFSLDTLLKLDEVSHGRRYMSKVQWCSHTASYWFDRRKPLIKRQVFCSTSRSY